MDAQPDDRATVEGALVQLQEVLRLVESGALTAGPDQLAYLRGAVDALRVVAQSERPSR